jgi:threonine dehydrogenase-like Zn-dependent dehydrogenase
MDAVAATGPYGIVCLTGVSSRGRRVDVDAGALNREMVLQNDVVVGSVNANLRHYRDAAAALGRADRAWLRRLVTRTLPVDRAAEAFEEGPHEDVKVVITFGDAEPDGGA